MYRTSSKRNVAEIPKQKYFCFGFLISCTIDACGSKILVQILQLKVRLYCYNLILMTIFRILLFSSKWHHLFSVNFKRMLSFPLLQFQKTISIIEALQDLKKNSLIESSVLHNFFFCNFHKKVFINPLNCVKMLPLSLTLGM